MEGGTTTESNMKVDERNVIKKGSRKFSRNCLQGVHVKSMCHLSQSARYPVKAEVSREMPFSKLEDVQVILQ